MSRYLHHITLTSGHSRRSYAGEVSPGAVAVCQDLIRRITSGETAESVEIPGTGCYLSGRASSRCLVASVWYPGVAASLATIGVAAHSRCGATLWRQLHTWRQTPVVTDPLRCPPEPWVAAALDAGIEHHMEAAHWLGDFERCLGWAWVRMVDH